MPKININEKDFTTPGASSNYANYAVLLVGYEGEEPNSALGETRHEISRRLAEKRWEGDNEVYNRPVAPDSNNVYEFTSAQDFAETIGLTSPSREIAEDTFTYHYGNRMAYELLNLGFAVIYKPIKSQDEIWDENTWEIFKDKVSYDFRFISHGLLESDETPLTADNGEGARYLKAKKQLISILKSNFEEAKDKDAACLPRWKEYLKIETDSKLYDTEGGYDPIVRFTAKKPGTEVPVLPFIPMETSEYKHKDDYAIERSLIHKDTCIEHMACNAAERETHWDIMEEQLVSIYRDKLEGYEELCEYITDKYTSEPDIFPANEGTRAKTKTVVASSDSAFTTVWNALGVDIDGLYQASLKFVKRTDINLANRVIANLAAYFEDDRDADEMASNSGRGDCIALLELDEKVYTSQAAYEKPEVHIIQGIKEMSLKEGSGKYCALTVPSVYYTSLRNEKSSVWGGSTKMPASFHYLSCFLRALRQNYAEWYATAGYTRGVSSLVIDRTSVRLGELAINALEPRNIKKEETDPPFACNVIANFRGSYYLWGNRTCAPLGAFGSRENGDLIASHFLNIRQLCTTIKKKLFTACRQFTFDPNSDVLWVNFCNAIRPTLENMRADQGIRDYKIIKLETEKKATLKAKIRIIPIEAVEDFILEVSLDDDFGVSITG
jgi:hypothetical protein